MSKYAKVNPAKAAELAMDEDSLLGHVKALQIATQASSPLSADLQLEITRAVADYLVSRLERGVPNQGRPLPQPYVRLTDEEVENGLDELYKVATFGSK